MIKSNTRLATTIVLWTIMGVATLAYHNMSLGESWVWVILVILMASFFALIGQSYRVDDKNLVISKFSLVLKRVPIRELRLISILGAPFPLLIHRAKPIILLGVSHKQQANIIRHINAINKMVESEELELACKNGGNVKGVLENIVLLSATVVYLSYSEGLNIIAIAIAVILVFSSIRNFFLLRKH